MDWPCEIAYLDPESVLGCNTGCLVAVIIWIYKFVTTGDPTPVPGLLPAY